jgi:hypothetical protein
VPADPIAALMIAVHKAGAVRIFNEAFSYQRLAIS